MWFNQAEPTIERTGRRFRIVFPARSAVAAFAYLFVTGVVAAPLLVYKAAWWIVLPLAALCLWPALCAMFNVVTLELTPEQTRASYGPVPWVRSRVTLGQLARLRLTYEVEVTTHSNSQHGGATTTSTRRVPLLKLSDVSGRSEGIALGPPRAGLAAANILDEISEGLTDELGLEAVAEQARAKRLKAMGTSATSAGGVGLCPRDDGILVETDDPLGGLRCPTCGGRTIDGTHSRQALEQTLGLAEADLRELSRMYAAEPIACPACGERSEAIQIKGETLNHCFACRTTWLDPDEIAPFEELIGAATPAPDGAG